MISKELYLKHSSIHINNVHAIKCKTLSLKLIAALINHNKIYISLFIILMFARKTFHAHILNANCELLSAMR